MGNSTDSRNAKNRAADWFRRRIRNPYLRWRDRRLDFAFEGRRDELVIYHHLGLGDHLICMGLVTTLLERHVEQRAHLAVRRAYVETVQRLYAAVDRLQLLPIDGADPDRVVYGFARRHRLEVARLGFEGLDPLHWDRSFYDQARVDFAASWDRFRPAASSPEEDALYRRLVPDTPYQLVHDAGSIGRFELRLPDASHRVVLRPEPGPAGLLAWRRIIREAAEIHCIDSSLVHLVDRMPPVPGQKLYLHDARGSGCTFTRRLDWTFVPYR